ncbi:MAG: HD domain-containing protein [Clostridia bacterium]|nr:HD domain-containing protein [Clostridia bacterium]
MIKKYERQNYGLLYNVSANEQNPKWNQMIKRENKLYTSKNDIRSPFQRDFNRILYSNAYKRLKSKTQVFFSPSNDHICTRIEHVNHVEAISYTIANELGLNVELTRAIAIAHDLGHGPFGHKGEKILNEISIKDTNQSFWHEKNGLTYVDKIELLDDRDGYKQNLYLTYAVRDGIISHCGEVDQSQIKPRENFIDLTKKYDKVAKYEPFTWEGCVVKISDKISYIGRDIEDAIRFNILDKEELNELKNILKIKKEICLNNTNIINNLIGEVLNYVTIDKGFSFSEEGLNLLNKIKAFNYEHIYKSEKLCQSNEYFKLIIHKIYYLLKSLYNQNTNKIELSYNIKLYPDVINEFLNWLKDYCLQDYFVKNDNKKTKLKNKKIFDISKKENYYMAIILYISGMTDNKAIDTFNKIISF